MTVNSDAADLCSTLRERTELAKASRSELADRGLLVSPVVKDAVEEKNK